MDNWCIVAINYLWLLGSLIIYVFRPPRSNDGSHIRRSIITMTWPITVPLVLIWMIVSR